MLKLVAEGRFVVLALMAFALSPLLSAQNTAPAAKVAPAAAPASAAAVPATGPAIAPTNDWGTKTFEVKYVDPERLRDLFSGRSFVMQADRDLSVLTAHGPAEFLKEVEDTVKRFDIPPPPPANLEITVYLLAVAAQAPAGHPLPAELAAIGKELTKGGAQGMKLADSQMIRVRAGEPGEAAGLPTTPESATLSRVRVQSAFLTPGPKGDLISMNGLRVWLTLPPNPDTAKTPAATAIPDKTDADFSANLDVTQNQAAMISDAGTDKPVVVVVRASVVK